MKVKVSWRSGEGVGGMKLGNEGDAMTRDSGEYEDAGEM